MSEVVKLEGEYEKAFSRAKEVLSSGGVIVYPTDTVYGIGGDARNKEVVERVREIKEKKEDSAFSILVANLEMVQKYAEVGEDLGYVMEAFPGAVTLILKAKNDLPVVKEGKIGVRVPEHIFMRKLSLELSMPIITTSANLSGKKAPVKVEEIEKEILEKVDLVLDGGETLNRMHSTILDIVEKKVVRVGAGEIII